MDFTKLEKSATPKEIKDFIYKCISNGNTTIHDLPDQIGKEQGKVGHVVRWLLDNDKLFEDEKGFLKVKEL